MCSDILLLFVFCWPVGKITSKRIGAHTDTEQTRVLLALELIVAFFSLMASFDVQLIFAIVFCACVRFRSSYTDLFAVTAAAEFEDLACLWMSAAHHIAALLHCRPLQTVH